MATSKARRLRAEQLGQLFPRGQRLGVDGFRLDVFTRFKKPAGFPDTKKEPNVLLDRNGFVVDTAICTNVEGIHEIIHELYTEVFGPCECMTVVEVAGVSHRNALDYICGDREELEMVYHFDLAWRGRFHISPELFRSVHVLPLQSDISKKK